MRDRISVIVPTCDRPCEFLDVALRSILDQSQALSEIIVVDNGLVPAQIAYSDARIRLHGIAPRCGAAEARNFGASQASGELLAFLDDDDWWDDNFLAEAKRRMEEAQADVVYGRMVHLLGDRVIGDQTLSDPPDLVRDVLMRNRGTGGGNVLLARAAFEEVGGFRTDLKTSEDRALAADLLIAGRKVVSTSNAIVYVRHHQGARLGVSVVAWWKFFFIYRKKMNLVEKLAYMRNLLRIIIKLTFRRFRIVGSAVKRRFRLHTRADRQS